MDYDKIHLPEGKDRRVKLTPRNKEEIRKKYYNQNVLYDDGTKKYSLKKLAKEYGVSKKLILITVNSESKEKNDIYIKEHWKLHRKPTKERTILYRAYRQYKRKCLKEAGIDTIEKAEEAGLINKL